MRLSCPNCSTEYDVPDAALAGRSRKLRCERCGHKWHTSAPAAPFVPSAPAWPVEQAARPAAPVPAAPLPAPPLPTAPLPATPVARSPSPAPVAQARPAAPPLAAPAPAYTSSPFAAAPPRAGGFPPPPVATVDLPQPIPAPAPPPEPPPAYSPVAPVWAATPAAPVLFPPPEPRQFGKPADDMALAEVRQAVAQEQKWQNLQLAPPEPPAVEPVPAMLRDSATDEGLPGEASAPEEQLPHFLTAAGADETLMLTAPYATTAGGDRFAELVFAARNKSIEVEPEPPPPPPPVRTSNMPLFLGLVAAFLIAFTLVEHGNIVQFMPWTRPVFGLIGLK